MSPNTIQGCRSASFDIHQFNLPEAIHNEGIRMCTMGPTRMAQLLITLSTCLETSFATDHDSPSVADQIWRAAKYRFRS
jgi:hypothetical protein